MGLMNIFARKGVIVPAAAGTAMGVGSALIPVGQVTATGAPILAAAPLIKGLLVVGAGIMAIAFIKGIRDGYVEETARLKRMEESAQPTT